MSRQLGMKWMWDGVDNPTQTDDKTWLVDGMKDNTIVWCTDGLYHRKLAPKVSGAGWMAYCTKTDNKMTGNSLEISDDAGSYRGKQLGLYMIHHLILSLCMFYNIENWHTTVNCDNQSAINMPEINLRRIQPGSSCADILWNIQNTTNKMRATV